MGIRANLIKEYKIEFGKCLGFNYDSDGFTKMLDECGVSYNCYDGETLGYMEICCDELLSIDKKQINDLNEEQQEAIKELIYGAKNFEYARNSGWLRVEWF